MYKIMIIEDDNTIRNELSVYLTKYNYEVITPINFSNIIEDVTKAKPHLILLDLNLPYYDGHYICKEIRKTSNTPIIVVTSRDSQLDELLSINLGADDYITKPYNPQILLARISGVIKRSYDANNANILQLNNIELNISKSTLSTNDNVTDLTKNELRIIH
ncbi:MAG: response regulator, partial [Erysipelotrichaceae bacterium]